MWMSHRHLKLTMSQMEPLIFPQSCSTHGYPVSVHKAWQIPFFPVAKMQNFEVSLDSSLSLTSNMQSVRKFYLLYFQNTFRIRFLTTSTVSTLLGATTIHLSCCHSRLPTWPADSPSCPAIVCSPLSCQNDSVRI